MGTNRAELKFTQGANRGFFLSEEDRLCGGGLRKQATLGPLQKEENDSQEWVDRKPETGLYFCTGISHKTAIRAGQSCPSHLRLALATRDGDS